MLLVVHDLGYPLGVALVPVYARVPRCVIAWLTFVLVVLLVRNLAQIRDSIIGSDSVNVIYLVFRPNSVDVEPGESVGFVASALYFDAYVAI